MGLELFFVEGLLVAIDGVTNFEVNVLILSSGVVSSGVLEEDLFSAVGGFFDEADWFGGIESDVSGRD